MSPRKQKKLDEFYLYALDEMFRRVGFEGYDKEFTNQRYWFTLREWTLEEDVAYKQWFISEYVKKLRQPKYVAEDAATMFIFNYGWKLKPSSTPVEGFRR